MIEDSNLTYFFYFLFYSFLGLSVGSFSSAIIHRIPRGKSWIWGKANDRIARSVCPQCDHALGIRDLIPVVSWLWQRGQCRHCQGKISVQYLLLELFCMLTAMGIYISLGITISGLLLLVALPFVLAQGVLFFQNRLLSKQLCAIIVVVLLFVYLSRFI